MASLLQWQGRSQIRLDLPLVTQKAKERTQGGYEELHMPGAMIVRSMPNERNCVLGLKATETDVVGTKSSVQELLDLPCVVDHGRLSQSLIIQ